MDKYEFKLKIDEMKALVGAGNYEAAAEITETINWRKVRNLNAMVLAGEIFERVGRYEESKEILLMAYDKSPIGRNIIYRLAEIAIKTKNFEEAKEYYDEFIDIAPHDNLKFVLKYKMTAAQGLPFDEQIQILEELKEQEYSEEWAYELAFLYHRNGQPDKCVEACDELILWFGDGIYVEKALELKMNYQPLSRQQEQKYRLFRQRRAGIIEVKPDDFLESGEIINETVSIPSVTTNSGVYNTANLQQELVRGMQQIINAREKEDVSDAMDNIKKLVEEIPYLSLPEEEAKAAAVKQITAEMALEDEIDKQLDQSMSKIFHEEPEPAPEGNEDEDGEPVSRETKPMSIEEILAEWEKTKQATQAVLRKAEERKLESAKERALEEAEDLMDRLISIMPQLSAGVTSKQLLEQEYLQGTGLLDNEEPSHVQDDLEEAGRIVAGMNQLMQEQIDNLTALQASQARQPQEPTRELPELSPEYREEENVEEDIIEEEQIPEVIQIEEESFSEEQIPEVVQIEEEPEEDLKEYPPKPEENFEGYLEEPKIPEENFEEYLEEPEMPEENFKEYLEEPEMPEEDAPEYQFESEEENVPEYQPEPEEENAAEYQIEPEKENISEYWSESEEESVPEYRSESEEESVSEYQSESEEESVPEYQLESEEESVSEYQSESEKESYADIEDEEEQPYPGELEENIEESAVSDAVEPFTEPEVLENDLNDEKEEIEEELSEEDMAAAAREGGFYEGRPEDKVLPAGIQSRKLTPEQKQIFSYFVPIAGMESQICNLLAGVSRHLQWDKNALSGNIIIEGMNGSGKTVLIMDIIKVLQKELNRPNGKIGKIDATALNQKDMEVLTEKVSGGCLIVESAGKITRETAVNLSHCMEQDHSGTLYILEDTRQGIQKALDRDSSFAAKFTEKISIPVFTSDELVAFGKAYANDMDYDIDEMGILALYKRISSIQKLDHVTTLTEVKDIVDEAIDHAEKGSLKKVFGLLTSTRYNDDNYVILREKDFEESVKE